MMKILGKIWSQVLQEFAESYLERALAGYEAQHGRDDEKTKECADDLSGCLFAHMKEGGAGTTMGGGDK